MRTSSLDVIAEQPLAIAPLPISGDGEGDHADEAGTVALQHELSAVYGTRNHSDTSLASPPADGSAEVHVR